MIRPWNMHPGDRFEVLDLTRVPSRTITYEVTSEPWSERGYFSRHRCWLIPRRCVSTSDGRPDSSLGTMPARYYSDERVARTHRAEDAS